MEEPGKFVVLGVNYWASFNNKSSISIVQQISSSPVVFSEWSSALSKGEADHTWIQLRQEGAGYEVLIKGLPCTVLNHLPTALDILSNKSYKKENSISQR